MTPRYKVAIAASRQYHELLRNWTGFDAKQFHVSRLAEIIEAAIETHAKDEDLSWRFRNDPRFCHFLHQRIADEVKRRES